MNKRARKPETTRTLCEASGLQRECRGLMYKHDVKEAEPRSVQTVAWSTTVLKAERLHIIPPVGTLTVHGGDRK